MKSGIIYKAVSPNGKIYVGKTVQRLEKRIIKHRYCSNSVKKYVCHFYSALRKYGFDNFKWEVIYKDIPEDMLDVAEVCAIYTFDSYNSGYNSTTGGDGGCDTFSKMSESRKESRRQELSKLFLGTSNPNYGKGYRIAGDKNPMHGLDAKNKIIAFHTGRKRTKQTSENIAMSKGSKCFNVYKDGEFIGKFISKLDCYRKTNIYTKMINKLMTKEISNYKGYTIEIL